MVAAVVVAAARVVVVEVRHRPQEVALLPTAAAALPLRPRLPPTLTHAVRVQEITFNTRAAYLSAPTRAAAPTQQVRSCGDNSTSSLLLLGIMACRLL